MIHASIIRKGTTTVYYYSLVLIALITDSHTFFFFFFWKCRLFRVFFVPFLLSLSIESIVRRTFFPSEWCFSTCVTTGWIFDISLCENSINQFNQSRLTLPVNIVCEEQTALLGKHTLLFLLVVCMYYYIVFVSFFFCPCMSINVSVQYNNGGVLPDIILLSTH